MNEIEERLRGDLFAATHDLEGDLAPDAVLNAAHRARRVRTMQRLAGVAGTAVVAAAVLLAFPGHLPGSGASVVPRSTAGGTASRTAPTSVRISPGIAENAASRKRPEVPAASGALDVDRFGGAQFSSPSGRIWCALGADSAACGFPDGMDTTLVPKAKEVCPGQAMKVIMVVLDAKGRAEYACGTAPAATPLVDTDSTAWWSDTGYPSVATQSGAFAVLPYGKKLVAGSFVCFSENTGVTCGNTDSGKGFKVSRAGVLFIN